jgi:FkbM family methyltransferase
MVGDGKVIEWRGHKFKIAEGTTHPAYSLTMMDEERDFRDRFWNIEMGDVVFDVGSSYGAYALPACASGAMVHAFEPESSVWLDLMRNVELNGWNSRFIGTCGGLWSKPGQVNMRSYAPHWPSHTITGAYKMDTLDNVVKARSVERMDWLKIDVEGAELHVLAGGMETIKKLKPKIIVECHVFLDPRLGTETRAMLESVGYSLVEVSRDPCVMLVGTPI